MKAYAHRLLAKDTYLGRVDEKGKVYESQPGLDEYVGRVDLETGKIYETRLGPDKLVGRIEEDGKVYEVRAGRDKYLGRVNPDGTMYHHKRLAPDQYIGKMIGTESLLLIGAAFQLLVLPNFKEELADAEENNA